MSDIDRLYLECLDLLQQLKRHRYAASLLHKARGMLQMAIAYKANRTR